MPLKADDLKTVENYKKAMKLEATRINAAGNVKFWVYRDVELPTAGGSKQKLPVLITLIDDNAVKPLLKGKQAFCRGVCGLREGKIAFDPAQGKVPYALMAKSVPLLLGKMVHMPSGVAPDARVEEDEEAPNPPPQGRTGQLTDAWKRLSQQAAQRVAAHPAERAAISQAAGGIAGLLQAGNLEEARKRMARLQAVLTSPAAQAAAPHPGIVPYRRALVEFAQAKSVVRSQVGALRQALAAQLPEEADFAAELAQTLEQLNSELGDAVDEAMQASRNEAAPASAAVQSKIRRYMTNWPPTNWWRKWIRTRWA